jgi:hypothetical protein
MSHALSDSTLSGFDPNLYDARKNVQRALEDSTLSELDAFF